MKNAEIGKCTTIVSDKKITLSGNGTSTIHFSNPKERKIAKTIVDGCAITTGPRCDWMLVVSHGSLNEVIYVELKGSDTYWAVKQLEETIKKFHKTELAPSKRCFIVYRKNRMIRTHLVVNKEKFKRRYGAVLAFVRDGAKESIEH